MNYIIQNIGSDVYFVHRTNLAAPPDEEREFVCCASEKWARRIAAALNQLKEPDETAEPG